MPSRLCEHGVQHHTCKRCDGDHICQHKRQRNACIPCGGSRVCPLCKSAIKNQKFRTHCARCYYFLNPEIAKAAGKRQLKADYIHDTLGDIVDGVPRDVVIPGNHGILRRPDYLFDLKHIVVILEIDEGQHRDYDDQCEKARIGEIALALDFRPHVYLRVNPDSYKFGPYTRNPSVFVAKATHLQYDDIAMQTRLRPMLELLDSIRRNPKVYAAKMNREHTMMATNYYCYDWNQPNVYPTIKKLTIINN